MGNSDTVILVTGAAGGLGGALAKQLATEGAKLVLTDIETDKLRAVAAKIDPDLVLTRTADLSEPSEIRAVVAGAIDRFGQLDAVVHTAGGDLRAWSNVLDYPDDAWRRCLDLNLTGSFNLIKAAGAAMKARGGHILMVGSGTSLRPTASNIGYAASKAGMLGLMRGAAMDLAEFDIRVNVIFPGLTLHRNLHLRENEAGEWVPLDEAYEAAIEKYKQNTALGSLSTPAQFAAYVSFLLTTRAISGQIINFDSKIYF